MDNASGLKTHNNVAGELWWKHAFYYVSHGCRILVSVAPLVFFCSLLERVFPVIFIVIKAASSQVTAAQLAQNQVSSSFSVAPAAMPQALWLSSLFLVCLTVLLIASMVLVARAIRRD